MMSQGCTRQVSIVALPVVVMVSLSASGCRKQDDAPEIIALEQAKIEKIDTKGRSLTVSYFNEKRDDWVSGTGLVTSETEIMINGVVAQLADLKVGERVQGQVRVEKKNNKRRQIALKIYVNRPKPVGGNEP